eukprot:scaffold710_cov81-Cylindrotheca_fusiformis.AAC.1
MEFGAEVRHVFLDVQPPSQLIPRADVGTPFHSAIIGAATRAKINKDVYCCPRLPSTFIRPRTSETEHTQTDSCTEATPLLEYVIMPRSKRGFCSQNVHSSHWEGIQRKEDELLLKSGAVEVAQTILGN